MLLSLVVSPSLAPLTAGLLAASLASAVPGAVPPPVGPRAPLVEDPPVDVWTGSVNFGYTLTRGNSHTEAIAGSFDAQRRGEKNRHTVKAFYNRAEQRNSAGDSEVTANNLGGSYKYDFFATKRLYYLGVAGAETNEIADLDLRAYVGAGAGYQFKETEKLKLAGEGALTYISEQRETGADSEYAALRLASNLWYEIHKEKGTIFEQTNEVFPSLEDSKDVTAKTDNRLKTSLTDRMFAQLQYVVDYDNTPADGFKRIDQRIVFTLGWSF
jgi:putative salt-induced outer membrane protein YdiY